MHYSVVIPERNEPENFKLTAENILSTQKNCNDIQHLNDVNGNGTSYSRHQGVISAKNDLIITCDAHMRFMPGALDKMAAYIADHQDMLCCLKCHHNPDMSFDDVPYCGAEIHWKQEEPNNNRALSAKWRGEKTAGQISAVMGACYGFKRSSYLRLGSPWRLGVAWGNDEETISIAIRLIGGSVELFDAECSHQARKVSAYQLTENDVSGVWYNRIRNLYYLPLSPQQRYELEQYVMNNPDAISRQRQIKKILSTKIEQISESAQILLENQTVSFEQYAQQWIKGYPNNNNQEKIMAKAASRRKVAATTTTTSTTTAVPITRKPLPVSFDYGIKCRHCTKVSNAHIVTHKYPLSRRYKCVFCERPFIVMDRFNQNPTK